jgi:DNA (cytosine-5)-methyltransferase 1
MQSVHPEPGFPALGLMPHALGLVYGSVCSGVEAATAAWEPLGWQPAFVAEIEPFPATVLAHHYPHVPNLGDMTAIDGRAWRGKIDMLVGGTPCQAFSVAGLRKSLDDARGNLALKFVELADAIDPAWVVWENVPGVLSTRDNAFGCLLGGLAGEDGPLVPPGGKWSDAGVVVGPTRTVAWRVLDAQYFGLAQRRRRVFVVAGAGDRADPVQVLFEREGVRRDHPPRREAEQAVAPTLDARAGRSGETSFATSGRLIAEAFGGNNTSGPIEIATALNACASASGRMDFETETFVATNVSCDLAETLTTGANQMTGFVGDCVATTLRARDLSRGVDSDCTDTLIAHTLRAKANLAHRPDIDTLVTHSLRGEGFDASEDGTGRGTPLVPVAIPIQEAGARTGISTTDPRAGIGIGGDSDPMFALQAGKQHAVAFNMHKSGNAQSSLGIAVDHTDCLRAFEKSPFAVHSPGMAVRRLTPRECERLQGFPDDYTLIPWRRKAAEDCPDGPRYRALGNSMAVPVMAWLGRRIQAQATG